MTKGEYRVGLDFNPSNSQHVDWIKRASADLIDFIEGIDSRVAEVGRLKALAQTYIETAAMWAVKAATKKPQEDELALAKSMDDPNFQELVEEPKEE